MMSAEFALIEKELTELLTKKLLNLRFPTGVEVIKESIRLYFDNYRQTKEMIKETKGGQY